MTKNDTWRVQYYHHRSNNKGENAMADKDINQEKKNNSLDDYTRH